QMGGGRGMMGGNANAQVPVSGSYLTLQPHLKPVLDAVEYGKDPALLSLCLDKESLRSARSFKKDSLIELLPPLLDIVFFDQQGNRVEVETSAVGLGIQALRPDRFTMSFAVQINDPERKVNLTQQTRQGLELQIALYLKALYNIDVQLGSQGGGQGMGMMGGGQGMMGGGPGMMGGGPGMMGGQGMMGGGPGMMGGGPGMMGGQGGQGPGAGGGGPQQGPGMMGGQGGQRPGAG